MVISPVLYSSVALEREREREKEREERRKKELSGHITHPLQYSVALERERERRRERKKTKRTNPNACIAKIEVFIETESFPAAVLCKA